MSDQCYFCNAVMPDKFGPHDAYAGWDWFAGYGEKPLHFCPSCRKNRAIETIRAKLNIRPANYPREYAEP